MKTALALLSGGLDSTVALAKALRTHRVVLALHFDYGQKARHREAAAARRVARHYKVPYRHISLPWLKEMTQTALVKKGKKVLLLKAEQLDDARLTRRSAHAVWVPNRNGAFINIAAALAESLKAQVIITGFDLEEAATFPDNSREFIDAVNRALSYSTLSKVKVVSPVCHLDKTQIVRLGRALSVPLEWTWSCYEGGRSPCHRCESCQRAMRALDTSKGS